MEENKSKTINIINEIFKVFKNSIIFKVQKKCDVIIYEDNLLEPIIKFVSPSNKFFILQQNNFFIFANPRLILNFIKFFFRKELLFNINDYGVIKGFFRYLKDIEHYVLIKAIKPKIIITFTDNNPRFGRISRKFKNIRFVAIQNGSRSSWELKEPCIQDVYLTFTKNEVKLLEKFKWEIKKSYPIGSINAARAFKKINNKNVKRDLLIISTWWNGNMELDINCLRHYKAMKEMHIYLRNFIEKEDFHAAIMLRRKKNSIDSYFKEINLNEEQYFKKIFGDKLTLIDNTNLRSDVYKEINNSNLSVSILGSSILEGHIYGHNCLYLNFFDNNFYHKDFPKEITFSKKNICLMNSSIKNKIQDSELRREEIFSTSKKRAILTIRNYKEVINKYTK